MAADITVRMVLSTLECNALQRHPASAESARADESLAHEVSRAVLVTVANSAQFGNGARIAPRALLDDGLLDLVVVEERARWRTVCHIPRLFDGTVERIPGCSICHIQHATIESVRPLLFHVDGEPIQVGSGADPRSPGGASRCVQ
jgi:diacylglycerol kinase family enzyme